MTVDVLIQSLAVVLAASIPAAFGLIRMKKTAITIEEVRRELSPVNGTRIAQLAYDTQKDVAELRNDMFDMKWEMKNHIEEHKSKKRKKPELEPEQPTHTHSHNAYDGFGAASVQAIHKHD